MKQNKRNLENLGSQNGFKKQTSSRKKKRKTELKQKKIKKAIDYANSKKTRKVCINPTDLNIVKNSTKIYSTLSNKICSNIQSNDNGGTLKKKRKRKKKKKFKTAPENDSINKEETSTSSSFKMSNASNVRLAKLQEFVNQESNKLRTPKNHPDKKKEKSNQKNNLIKDKNKLEDLREGQKIDQIEVNRYARKLKLNSHQKKGICPIFADDFGEILADIEGDSFNLGKYEKNELDYNSDDNFENDMLIALGKKGASKGSKTKKNKCKSEEVDEDEEMDTEGEIEGEEEEIECDIEEEEDDNEDIEGEDEEIEEDTEEEIEDQEEIEEEEDVEKKEYMNRNEFLDDEAEEDSECYEDSEGELEDNPEEIIFESGSMSTSKSLTESTQITFNSLFNGHSSDSSEDDEADLEDFVVDDNFVEYESESGSEIEPKRKRKSRIVGREIRNDSISDAEPPAQEGLSNHNQMKKCKRRRILSEESEIDSPLKRTPQCVNNNYLEEENYLEEKNMAEKLSLTSNINTKSSEVKLENKKNKNKKKKKKKKLKNCTDKINLCNILGEELNVDEHCKSILKESQPKEDKAITSKNKTNGINIEPNIKPQKRVSFSNVENGEVISIPEEEQVIELQNGSEEYHEDIYGRLRDKQGKIVCTEKDKETKSKYIPPAMRKLMELNNDDKKKEQLAALQRRLKGLFNRVAESNMNGIVSQFEGIYQINSRNDMNDTLTKLIFEMLVTPVLAQERLAQEYALLVAALSANVGPEVGAHILTEFVLKWVDEFENFEPVATTNEIDSKELDNLLLFISQLYNFKVMDATLIYDILYKILERPLEAKEVDLILLVLRSVGFTLRKDNPLELKRFITEVQSKTSDGSAKQSEQCYTRVKFMLEVLTAIRNNNMAKVPNFDPSHSQHLKSLMKGVVRKGCRTSDLKISLADLVKSKVVGKWWVIGSAWSGGLKEDMDWSEQEGLSSKDVPLSKPAPSNDYSDTFRKKAAALHMSRPPRINILYAITVGSENFNDAFEKLLKLKLQSNQEQEIFNVMLYCCERCKVYKTFYVQLAMKLCKFRKSFKRLLQFCIWDKLKELNSMKPMYAANLAKFVSHLISEDCLNLSLVKTLNFVEADGKTVSFLRQTLIAILLHPTGTYAVSRAFNHLCSTPKLKVLRQYIRLFIAKFINPKRREGKEVKVLEARVKMALEILTSAGGVKL